MLKEVLLVGAGGFFGSILRYLLSMAISTTFVFNPINLGTLSVNIIGSFIIGFLLSSVSATHWHFLAIVGFCGGFTTFSTFSLELFFMIKDGHYAHGLLYLFLSVIICVLFVWIGILLGSYLFKS